MTKKNEEVIEKKEIKATEEHECKHEGCDCGCEDLDCNCFDDYVVPHKVGSFANILAITSKVIAVIVLLVNLWLFGSYIVNAVKTAGFTGVDWISELGTFCTQILFLPLILVAIGEVVNLLNRIKESLY